MSERQAVRTDETHWQRATGFFEIYPIFQQMSVRFNETKVFLIALFALIGPTANATYYSHSFSSIGFRIKSALEL